MQKSSLSSKELKEEQRNLTQKISVEQELSTKMEINLRHTLCLCWALYLLVTVCQSQCPNPSTFETVPEDDYDRDFRNVKPGERPVGFEFTILYYEADGQPNPCYEIPDTGDRRVEIMAEPDGGASSQICVRDQLGRELCDTRIYDCRQANADSLNLEFFCDAASCDESDVRMWVRFTVSPPADELDPELWCDERNTGEYPSSLAAPLRVSLRAKMLRTPRCVRTTTPRVFADLRSFVVFQGEFLARKVIPTKLYDGFKLSSRRVLEIHDESQAYEELMAFSDEFGPPTKS